jgi:hypothetical protein
MRYAGDVALVGLAGAGGAVLADQLAHSPMDRLAQEYQDNVKGPIGQGNDAFQEIFAGLRSQVKSGADQLALIRTLSAGSSSIPPEEMQLLQGSPESMQLVEMAQKVRDSNPAAAIAMGRIALQETQLILKEKEAGVSPQEVVQAREEGAGVSQIPAILGGLGIGGGTAALAALARRRGGGDPFQVRR